ncbi:MAG: type II toxin-antitoxin system VapC family toxin [Thermoanaerobaculales bacterium]|jgi:PIN domain nuclease of toxin-antitoxin system|nr:type II toxin-antitoxin system VapC family toxin [Thermoanaerobaculales bacterium]
MLLDTHVLVWLTEGRPELGPEARAAIDGALVDDAVLVSAISFWEIAMLARKGRLALIQPPSAYRRDVLALGIGELPVTGEIGIEAVRLELDHPDPADRLIIATAALARQVLVTADHRVLDWDGPLRRLDARV